MQKNKDGKVVIIYTTDPVQQDAFVQGAQGKGYKVVKMETFVDAAFINHMEMKWENVQFTRVDADIADNLVNKNEEQTSVLSKDEEEKLKICLVFKFLNCMWCRGERTEYGCSARCSNKAGIYAANERHGSYGRRYGKLVRQHARRSDIDSKRKPQDFSRTVEGK